MQKNSLRPIPCKKITYEETFSMDQISFISHKTHLPNQPINPKPIILPYSSTPSSLLSQTLQKHNHFSYNNLLIHLLITKTPSHIYTAYSEMKLILNQTESLRRMYSISDSHFRLPKFETYYKHYIKYLSKPTLTSESINKLIHEKAKKQSQVYFNMAYGYKKSNEKHHNDNNHQIIFDSTIKETIENYSTTMTCESNEALICSVEVFNENDIKSFFTKNSEITFTSNEFDLCGITAANRYMQNYNDIDNDNNESILAIMKDLKNKSKSKSKSKSPVRSNNECSIKKRLVNKASNKILNTNISSERNKKISFITINPNHTKQNEKKYKNIKKQSTSSKIIITHNQQQQQQQLHTKKVMPLQNNIAHTNNNYNNNNNNASLKTYKTRRLSEIVPKIQPQISQSKEISTCKHSTKVPTFTSFLNNNPRKSKSPINKHSKLTFHNTNTNTTTTKAHPSNTQYHSLQTEVKSHFTKSFNYKELYVKRNATENK